MEVITVKTMLIKCGNDIMSDLLKEPTTTMDKYEYLSMCSNIISIQWRIKHETSSWEDISIMLRCGALEILGYPDLDTLMKDIN
jgi:hypothetical protein